MLLAKGADADIKDKDGLRAVDYANQFSTDDLSKLFEPNAKKE
jgi:hypothetical protein